MGAVAMAIDRSFSYGYVDDYYGYGSYLMYYSPIYGSFAAVTSATSMIPRASLNIVTAMKTWNTTARESTTHTIWRAKLS